MTRYTRLLSLLAALVVPVLLLAPGAATHAAGPAHARVGLAPSATHRVVQVAISNFAFKPATLTVTRGTTVMWTNKDSAPHTVTSNTNAWKDSGALSTGKHFSFTFTRAGTYAYHCAFHPFMKAKVIVK